MATTYTLDKIFFVNLVFQYRIYPCIMCTPILKPVFRRKAFQRHSCWKIIYSEVPNNSICMIIFLKKKFHPIQLNLGLYPAFWSAILLPFEKLLFSEQEIENKTDEIAEKRSHLRWFLMVLQLFCFQSPHSFFCFYYLLSTISYFSTLYYYSVLYYYWLFEILPPYTIINFCTFVHPIPLFCPILLFGTSEQLCKNLAEMSNLALPAWESVAGVDANHLMFCLFSDTSSFMMFSSAVLLLHDRMQSICTMPVTFLWTRSPGTRLAAMW